MKTGRATPTDGSAESTVFADVERMELNGASVRVYDCAGQVFHGCGADCFGFCVVVALGVSCRLGLRMSPGTRPYVANVPGRYGSGSVGWTASNTFSMLISRYATSFL